MSKRILNILMYTCALTTIFSCSEKREIEHRIDGLWEVQLSSEEDYLYWYDTCGYIDQVLFFDLDQHDCTLPSVAETLEERAKENYKGEWSINKTDSHWTITINPRKHPLQGLFHISFYKDTVFDSDNSEKIRYFMKLENERWSIECIKCGMINNPW